MARSPTPPDPRQDAPADPLADAAAPPAGRIEGLMDEQASLPGRIGHAPSARRSADFDAALREMDESDEALVRDIDEDEHRAPATAADDALAEDATRTALAAALARR